MAIDSSGKIFSSRGKEPTREQIKEAFQKTIERWEKIVEDVDYHNESRCPLCSLFPGYLGSCNRDVCPVGIFAESFGCNSTPYHLFNEDKTPANALAELNFLRKVYIWWMEGEEGVKLVDYLRKEKEEEWENITPEIDIQVARSDYYKEPGEENYFLRLYHGGNQIGIISGGQIKLSLHRQLKAIYHNDVTRILKRV